MLMMTVMAMMADDRDEEAGDEGVTTAVEVAVMTMEKSGKANDVGDVAAVRMSLLLVSGSALIGKTLALTLETCASKASPIVLS